jgi:chromosomal replication initiation ATPase DnaA
MSISSLSPGVWQTALAELQLQLPKETFDLHLRGSSLLRVEGDCYVIGLHSTYAREWLDKRLRPVVERTLARQAGQAVAVAFEVRG